MRYADFGVLHRNELAGALGGLTRVRRFQQDDAHIYCRNDQIEDEIKRALDFVDYVYGVFGFRYELYLSTRPENYLGGDELWDRAEKQLEESLNWFKEFKGIPWKINAGDGAFYGPKIDIKLFDAMKREHQCGTIQLDFQAPIRFNLNYRSDQMEDMEDGNDTDASNKTGGIAEQYEFPSDEWDPEEFRWEVHNLKPGYERPVVIHRAVLGSVERFYSILMEHCGGKWPTWISPRQAIILPIAERHNDYSESIHKALKFNGFRSEVDDAKHTSANKVRMAEKMGWNYMLTVGDAEIKLGMVDVRARGGQQLGKMRVNEFIELLKRDRPNVSDAEREAKAGMWTDDYPFDQRLYEEILAEEEERKRKEIEEKRKRAQEKAERDAQKAKEKAEKDAQKKAEKKAKSEKIKAEREAAKKDE